MTRLGDLLEFGQLLKPLATINLYKSLTFLGNFCKEVKMYHFSFIDIWQFFLVTLLPTQKSVYEIASRNGSDVSVVLLTFCSYLTFVFSMNQESFTVSYPYYSVTRYLAATLAESSRSLPLF